MINLLSSSNQRRLQFLEVLSQQTDWITLVEISRILDCSERILKHDMVVLKENYTDFSIITSQQGLKIVFQQEKGLRSIYSNLLESSVNHQLLEALFLYEKYTLDDIQNKFFISLSTVYRMVKMMNNILEPYSFKIETTPFHIGGDEESIRYFYYQYFYEKYSYFEWPYKGINEEALDELLNFLIDFTGIPVDFSYYHVFKTVAAVNLVRYKNGHEIDTSKIKNNFHEILPDLSHYADTFKEIEETLAIKIDDNFIEQVFTGYIQEEFSLTEERLMEKTKTNEKLAEHVNYLENMFEALSKKNKIPIPNKSELIFTMTNIAHLEYLDPLSGYILYNKKEYVIEKIKTKLPEFSQILYNTVKTYRAFLGKPLTEEGITYYMYAIFITWENLIPELFNQLGKITVVIASDFHISHARLWKDFLEYSFTNQLEVEIFQARQLSVEMLEALDCDIVLTTFPIEKLKTKASIYVETLPIYIHNMKIQNVIDQINSERRR